MKKPLLLLLLVLITSSCDFSDYVKEEKAYDFTTVFERSQGQETATYSQVIEYYRELASEHGSISLERMGETDSGEPLHLALFSPAGEFDLDEVRKDRSILLINNGIHPGESDGIDATMMLFRDLAGDSVDIPENTVIATIPVYNIGGALNRNTATRANQNGPAAYGFRGNARNYDLNRDFIKADTRNTRSFYEIFHYVQPDVFIDNHVSNGADYQYTLTHLFTQHNKLGGKIGKYLNTEMMPALEDALQRKEWDITPYVNVFNEVPESGFSQFMDYPRYSTGYTTLWNTLGMMVETHMLKPYDKRVRGTYELMRSMIDITDEDSKYIRELRSTASENFQDMKTFRFDFKPDSTAPSQFKFKGYEASRIKSEVTGFDRLKYDTTRPFTTEVTYYNNFKASRQVEIPEAYVIPQGWWEIIELLELNQIQMKRYQQDTSLVVQVYHIEDYSTRKAPYEGHYLHSDTKVQGTLDTVKIRKGDIYVSTRQPGIRYILETLEPEANDSFFNWNYFDSVLQQKEHFSPYVFEDKAREILDNRPGLEGEFNEKKRNDRDFANSWYAQLEWIYENSEHYEDSYLRYPIFRILR